MPDAPQGPKLHVDDDWKAELQAEKHRVEEKVKAAETSRGTQGVATSSRPAGVSAGGRELPPASFETLVSTMASQALLFLGAFPDPRTGQRVVHPELAKHNIDILGMLEAKTKGNLTPQENELINSTLYELRQAYIQILTAQREQRKGG